LLTIRTFTWRRPLMSRAQLMTGVVLAMSTACRSRAILVEFVCADADKAVPTSAADSRACRAERSRMTMKRESEVMGSFPVPMTQHLGNKAIQMGSLSGHAPQLACKWRVRSTCLGHSAGAGTT
jgi:hypothetical protein